MDFGMFMEFSCQQGLTHAEAFKEGFRIVDAAEEWGLDGAWESIKLYFGRMGNIYRESAGVAGIDATELRQGRAARLASLTYEDILERKVAFGSPEFLVDRLAMLKEELGLNYVVGEFNAGGLIPPEQVLTSLKLVTHKVMPTFR